MEPFTLTGADDAAIHTVRWLPAEPRNAVVQIAHGMGEHIARYDYAANRLTEAGFTVYGNDHRGHGKTATPQTWGDMGIDGWNRTIEDTSRLNAAIANEHPGAKRVLLGHSMGSMLAQQYLFRYGHTIDAAVLSGCPGSRPQIQTMISSLLARFEAWRLGRDASSDLMQKLLFGKANEPFDGPDATGFEWLSRDTEQVRHYIEDPACGFVLRTGSLVDLFAGAREAGRQSNIATIPRVLPIYIFSGSDDPVHANLVNLDRLISKYRKAGLTVHDRFYPGGRHESFNETNRDEVLDDLISWLRATLG